MSSDISTLIYLANKYSIEDAGEIYDMQDAASAAVDIVELLEAKIDDLTKQVAELDHYKNLVLELDPDSTVAGPFIGSQLDRPQRANGA